MNKQQMKNDNNNNNTKRANGDNLIEFRNVSFSYEEDGKKATVINNFSLEIKRGSFVALLGKNGSGKSTVAKLMNMLLEPSAGDILIDGKSICNPDMSDEEFFDIRRRIGMVFQNPDNQIVTSVVEEDIAFGPENLGVEPHEIRKRVDEVMEIMGLTELARANPAKLSGGQKQRVAIAGVLAMQPECMIFDESTAMLDPSGRKEVMSMITKLSSEMGITVVLITHNMDEAALADRVVVIDHSGIRLDGNPHEVFSNGRLLSEAGLELPQTSELLQELAFAGYNIGTGATSEDECAGEILKLFSECAKKGRKSIK